MIEVPTFRFAVSEDLKTSGIDFMPRKAHPEDTGWDVKSSDNFLLRPGQYAKIPLGFRVLAPKGWWLELRPRSSTFAKKQLHCLYGVIDEIYEGQCLLACHYMPDISSMGRELKIEYGEAIGQIIPVKREEMVVESISNEEYNRLCMERNAARGSGGFGSSGS